MISVALEKNHALCLPMDLSPRNRRLFACRSAFGTQSGVRWRLNPVRLIPVQVRRPLLSTRIAPHRNFGLRGRRTIMCVSISGGFLSPISFPKRNGEPSVSDTGSTTQVITDAYPRYYRNSPLEAVRQRCRRHHLDKSIGTLYRLEMRFELHAAVVLRCTPGCIQG